MAFTKHGVPGVSKGCFLEVLKGFQIPLKALVCVYLPGFFELPVISGHFGSYYSLFFEAS